MLALRENVYVRVVVFSLQIRWVCFIFLNIYNRMLHDNKSWVEEAANAELAVKAINQLKPAFAIVCGDLVHAYPSNPKVQSSQIKVLSLFFFFLCFSCFRDTHGHSFAAPTYRELNRPAS